MDQLGRAELASSARISDVQESSHEVDAMTPPDTTVSGTPLSKLNPRPTWWTRCGSKRRRPCRPRG